MAGYLPGIPGVSNGADLSNIWDGLKKQSPLETETDYFEGTTLDPKWTQWDVGADQSVTVSDGAAHLTQSSSADNNYSGIIQVLPGDNEFCITAKIRMSGRYGANISAAGLVVGEDLINNPATASFFANHVKISSTGIFWDGQVYTDYTTFSGVTIGTEDIPAEHVLYLRWYIDRVAATATAMASADGRTWIFYPARALAGTVVSSLDTAGIGTVNVNTGDDVTLHCDMYRIDITTDPFFEVGGTL